MSLDIYTVGHSNHTWETFAPLLKEHGIEALVDTRSSPVSKYADFANTRTLLVLLDREGIRYLNMGDSLGGKPTDQSCYDAKGKPDYRKIRAKAFFQEGVETLSSIASGATVALMCAEEDPTKCHRRLLIGPALEALGVTLLHIRADGSVQREEALGGKKAYKKQLQGTLPF